ncbi:MAG: CocE/NonD family hydrolase [Pseudomonadota bacterium]
MRHSLVVLALGLWAAMAQAEPEVRETPAYTALPQAEPRLVKALGLTDIRMTHGFIDVEIAGDGAHRLEVLWATPADARAGDNRPAIVITHGNPRRNTHRGLRLHRYGWLASEFARRGYIALVLARRGFGASSGTYDEWYAESCAAADADGYMRGGRQGAKDLRAALAYLSDDPRVDPDRLMTMGVSGGGFASLALAADPPPGLVGVINFSGGRGSVSDGRNCNADGLTKAFHTFGHAGARPSLWLYARTDRFFWPELVEAHFAGFQAPARLVMFDDILHAEDGHRLFQRGNTILWRPAMDEFLRDLGLQTWTADPDGVALDKPAPSGLSTASKALWLEFLGAEMHRAFAIGEDGKAAYASAYPSPADAAAKALETCLGKTTSCRVTTIDESEP